MQKILTYDLGAKDGTLPDIPWLHDYKLSDIQIESGKIKLTSKDFGSHDYDYSDITGFHPKKVTVEFLCGDTGEPAERNVISFVSARKSSSGKTINSVTARGSIATT